MAAVRARVCVCVRWEMPQAPVYSFTVYFQTHKVVTLCPDQAGYFPVLADTPGADGNDTKKIFFNMKHKNKFLELNMLSSFRFRLSWVGTRGSLTP